jgi:hypothetical protein
MFRSGPNRWRAHGAHFGLYLATCLSALKFRWAKEASPASCLATWIRLHHWYRRRGDPRILTWNRDVSSCDSYFCKRYSLRVWIAPAKGILSWAIPTQSSDLVASFSFCQLAGWTERLKNLPNQPCKNLPSCLQRPGLNNKRTITLCYIEEPNNPHNPVVSVHLPRVVIVGVSCGSIGAA